MAQWWKGKLATDFGPRAKLLVALIAASHAYLVYVRPYLDRERELEVGRARSAESAAASGASAQPAEREVIAELNAPPSARLDAPNPKAPADLVVLISVDGLRPDVIARHAEQIRRLQVDGTSALNGRTISKSATLPSHASMVSGVDFQRHGLGFNAFRPERGHIQYPTIFSAAQQANLTTALFVGKMKLRHLLNPESESHFAVGGVYCSKVNKLAVPYLLSAESGLVFLHFSDPDGAGHTYGWMGEEYLAAVRRADRCVGQVVAALRERGKLDRTLLVLTADHGGHDHDHHSPIPPDTHIPWIAWGGMAPKRERIARVVYNTDTAATILYALGLPMPKDIQGRPVMEAFAAGAAPPTTRPN